MPTWYTPFRGQLTYTYDLQQEELQAEETQQKEDCDM